jgi:hypothetical protein
MINGRRHRYARSIMRSIKSPLFENDIENNRDMIHVYDAVGSVAASYFYDVKKMELTDSLHKATTMANMATAFLNA